MIKYISFVVLLNLSALFTSCRSFERVNIIDCNQPMGDMTLVLQRMEVTDKVLELRYQIRNVFEHDIWICDDVSVSTAWHIEIYLDQDGHTFMIRRRHDIPSNVFWGAGVPVGRYVRLPQGQARTESLTLALPVHCCSVFYGGRALPDGKLEYPTRLAIEIGYYTGDLPGMVRGILDEAEKASNVNAGDSVDIPSLGIELSLGELYLLNHENKDLSIDAEEVLIPYTNGILKGERFSRVSVEGVLIPYEDVEPTSRSEIKIDRSGNYLPD